MSGSESLAWAIWGWRVALAFAPWYLAACAAAGERDAGDVVRLDLRPRGDRAPTGRETASAGGPSAAPDRPSAGDAMLAVVYGRADGGCDDVAVREAIR